MSKYIGNIYQNIKPNKNDTNLNTPFKSRPIKHYRLQKTNINNSTLSSRNVSLRNIEQPNGISISQNTDCINSNAHVFIDNILIENNDNVKNCCEPYKALLKFKQKQPHIDSKYFENTKSRHDNRNYSIEKNSTKYLLDKFESQRFFEKYDRNEFYTKPRVFDTNIYHIGDIVSLTSGNVNNKYKIRNLYYNLNNDTGGTYQLLTSPQLLNEITHIIIENLNGNLIQKMFNKNAITKIADFDKIDDYVKVYYKPSNHVFAINNAASSSNRTSRLKYISNLQNNPLLNNTNNFFLSEKTECTLKINTRYNKKQICTIEEDKLPPIIFSKNTIPALYTSLLLENDIRSKTATIQFRVPLTGDYYCYIGGNIYSFLDNETIEFNNTNTTGENYKNFYDLSGNKITYTHDISYNTNPNYFYWFEDTSSKGNIILKYLETGKIYTLTVNSDFDDFNTSHDIFICLKHLKSTTKNMILGIIDTDLYLQGLTYPKILFDNSLDNIQFIYASFHQFNQSDVGIIDNGIINGTQRYSKTYTFTINSTKNHYIFLGSKQEDSEHNESIIFNSVTLKGNNIDTYYNISGGKITFVNRNNLPRLPNVNLWYEQPSLTRNNLYLENIAAGNYKITIESNSETPGENIFIRIIPEDNLDDFAGFFYDSILT